MSTSKKTLTICLFCLTIFLTKEEARSGFIGALIDLAVDSGVEEGATVGAEEATDEGAEAGTEAGGANIASSAGLGTRVNPMNPYLQANMNNLL